MQEVIGQKASVKFLNKVLDSGFRNRSFLFVGPRGAGKRFVAERYALALTGLEEGTGVRFLDPKSSVQDVRSVVKWMETYSLAAACKCVVVEECHLLSAASMNTALKCLEEGKGVWVFTSSNEKMVLDTIKSRCFSLRFKEYSEDDLFRIAKSWRFMDMDARSAASEACGSVYRLWQILEGEYADAEQVVSRIVDAVKRKKLARLINEFSTFRGKSGRELWEPVLDILLARAVSEGWSVSILKSIEEASVDLLSGCSPILVMSTLLVKFGEVK